VEVFDLVYTHKIDARLNYSFEGCTVSSPMCPHRFANWFGVLNYLTLDFTPRLSGTTRREFFDDASRPTHWIEGLYNPFNRRVIVSSAKRFVIFRPEVALRLQLESRPHSRTSTDLFTAAGRRGSCAGSVANMERL